jgi:NADPH:quinone reductase-like Zn-dependent oxidoreductase
VHSNYSTHFRAQARSGTCDRKVLERREGPDRFGRVRLPGQRDHADLLGHAAAGTVRVDVTAVLDLEQAAAELATIAEGKAAGNIVVQVS